MRKKQGFTFVQILVILFIIGLIAAGIIFIVKPSKILEKSRDAQRFDDIKILSEALNRYLADGYDFKNLSGSYSSIDAGFKTESALKQIDGTGWIPLNFNLISAGVSFSSLPIDPLNNTNHNYRFAADKANKTYELEVVFESEENVSKHSTDSGNNPNTYELGTDLTIL